MSERQMAPTVVNNAERRQFEIREDAGVARLRYAMEGDVIELIHTEVPPSLEGRGYGGQLARAALQYAAEQSMVVKPTCSFVRSFMERNRNYAKLTERRDD
jgi:predicted GNAT family acetyltransferase